VSRPRDPDHAIWDAEIERDYPEPLSRGEEARLDNAYEKQMEANWP
jgi:hypothetical protein